MPQEPNEAETATLEQVNAELRQSLERCQALLQECRTNLAANSNEFIDDDVRKSDAGTG